MRGVLRFYDTTLGKKYVMAVTGLVWLVYLFAHMAANLLIFGGPDALDAYARFLREHPVLLWTSRIALIVSFVLHVIAAVQLSVGNLGSGGGGYVLRRYREADLASRTMLYGGIAVLLFVGFHLLDLTTGTVHRGFVPGAVRANVMGSFQNGWVVAVYLVALGFLVLHLYHGAWSFLQTLGAEHPLWNRWRRGAAVLYAIVVFVGFVSVPIAVLIGLVP